MAGGTRSTGEEAASLDAARLAEFIRHSLPEADAISLSDVTRASGGVSRDHFLFDLRWSEGGTRHEWPLVLIRDGDRPAQTDRGDEFHLLRALEETAIPAPKAYWCDTRGEWLERPFIVMERVGGAVTPPFQIPYADDPALRQRLTGTPDCATADLAEVAARHFRATVETIGVLEPDPRLERGMAWCIEHAPRTRRWTVCHGDYKPDNILHEGGEILAVIDWERARIGDPMADLGYVCAPHLRVSTLASGLAEPEGILRRYADRTGFEVEPEVVRFWQVHLLLQTCLYFGLQTADAARRGHAARPEAKPMMAYLLKLVDETLD
jgi:aminoglycoside phosphotransferase (APT) family kinase protein